MTTSDLDQALAAPTLGEAIEIRGRQGKDIPRGDVAAFGAWLAGNLAVLNHWGEVPHDGLTEDAAAMAKPNPNHADAA
jgi:hypothetical protein